MPTFHTLTGKTLTQHLLDLAQPGQDSLLDQTGWLDVLDPEPEHEAQLERLLGLDLPTRQESHRNELMGRFYVEDNVVYLSVSLLFHSDTPNPDTTLISFIVTPNHLVTVHYETPKGFELFRRKLETGVVRPETPMDYLYGLVDVLTHRLADALHNTGEGMDNIGLRVFHPERFRKGSEERDLKRIMQRIGTAGDMLAKLRESLHSLERMLAFLVSLQHDRVCQTDRHRFKTLHSDVKALLEHCNFLAQELSFILDATIGQITVQQNAIIKIFSVAAVLFLPPTLIASIYGMNFHRMPELDFAYGYPMALGLMVLSALVSLWVFKRNHWL